MQALKSVIQQAAPYSLPASYLTFYQNLDLAAKVGGLTVLVLQGIYTGICIYKKLKGGKKDDAE